MTINVTKNIETYTNEGSYDTKTLCKYCRQDGGVVDLFDLL